MRKFAHVFSTILFMAAAELESGASGSTTATDSAVTALTPAKKPRKPSVSTADFVAALAEATKREKRPTAAELAKELDMEKGSFDQRLNQLRNNWKDMVADKETAAINEDGTAKPFPFTLADGRSSVDGVSVAGKKSRNAILAALMTVDATSP